MTIDLKLGGCLELMKDIPDGSVDMVLCDLPYGEVNRASGGLRNLDKGLADICEIDLNTLISEDGRVCRSSVYLFCGVDQISALSIALKKHGFTTRLGQWEKTNPSPMNGSRLWLSGSEFCVFGRRPNST